MPSLSTTGRVNEDVYHVSTGGTATIAVEGTFDGAIVTAQWRFQKPEWNAVKLIDGTVLVFTEPDMYYAYPHPPMTEWRATIENATPNTDLIITIS